MVSFICRKDRGIQQGLDTTEGVHAGCQYVQQISFANYLFTYQLDKYENYLNFPYYTH